MTFSIPPGNRWHQSKLTFVFDGGFDASLAEIVRELSARVEEVCGRSLREKNGSADILWREGDPGDDNEGRSRIVHDKPVVTIRPDLIGRRGERRATQILRH